MGAERGPLPLEEALRVLTAEEAQQSVVITDPDLPDNPVIFVSDEFERQTGYTAEEVVGRNCRFLQGPDTDPRAVATIRRALERREGITIDLLNYRKDGAPFWNRLRIRPQYDHKGRFAFFVGAQNPIPEQEARPPTAGA
jgi:PAS domain S-box-containing protein